MNHTSLKNFQYNNAVASLNQAIGQEAALLKAEQERILNASPSIDASGIRGKFADELEALLAWGEYLRRQIDNEFSNLPPSKREQPRSECMPRIQARRIQLLCDELITEDWDPFMRLVVEFCAEVIFSESIGASLKQISHYRLREAMEKRLIPINAVASGSTTQRGVGVGTGPSGKPKLKPTGDASWG